MSSIYIDVVVPSTILRLCCSMRPPKVYTDRRYNLNDYDPDYLKLLVDLVQRAHPNQLKINRAKPKNIKTERALMQYNALHPDDQLTLEDLVKYISLDTYSYSVTSTEPGYEGEELHVFKNVVIPGFSTNKPTKIYVKFIDPDGQYPIDVVSVHRNCDQ